MQNIDYSLYLVTDRGLSLGRDILTIIKQAIEGGVTVVQLREKDCSTREFYEVAKKTADFLKTVKVPLIINDRMDIALAVKAEGLHIGQSDMPYEIARKIMGKDAIIGLSVENLQDALDAENLDVDYLGLSPVFSTPTKQDISHQLGLEGVIAIRKASRHKLIAIGGINADNCAEIVQSGADGIAVVSAICSSESPKTASEQLLREINQGRRLFNETK